MHLCEADLNDTKILKRHPWKLARLKLIALLCRRYRQGRLGKVFHYCVFPILSKSYFFAFPLLDNLISHHRKNEYENIHKWNRKRLTTVLLNWMLYCDARIVYAFSKIKIFIPGLSCLLICKK